MQQTRSSTQPPGSRDLSWATLLHLYSHTLTPLPESKHKVPLVVSFVSGSLRPVRSETDANLAHWYKKHSRVYVAADHLCWTDPELERKVTKSRFGRVVKSGVEGLNKMLRAHLPEVVGLLGSVGEEGEEE